MPTVIDTITNITLEPYFEKELHQAFASYGKILNNRIPLEDIFEFNKSEVATVADYIVVVINFCSYFGHLLPASMAMNSFQVLPESLMTFTTTSGRIT